MPTACGQNCARPRTVHEPMSKAPPQRLFGQFVRIALPCSLAVFIGFVAASDVITTRSEQARLQDKLDHLSSVYSLLFAAPLAEGADEELRVYSISLISDPEIAFIEVTRPDGQVVELYGEPPPSRYLRREAISYADDQGARQLGSLRLGVTPEPINATARQRLQREILLLVLLFGAMMLSLKIAFRRAVEQPVQVLTDAIAQARAGQRHEDLALTASGELRGLVAGYNQLQQERNQATAQLAEQQRLLEQQVQERTEELARSNRDLEHFAYVISHDMQAPLRTVSGFARLIEKRHGQELPAAARDLLSELGRGVTRMHEMIQGILQLSRVGRGRVPEYVDLNQTLETVLKDLAAPLAEAGARVEADPLPALRGRAPELRQLLQNLLENAIKYQAGAPEPIRVLNRSTETDWLLGIQDHGPGIPEALQAEAFKLFRRLHTEEQAAGTGLGLAICKRVVEGLQGRIWVESSPGQGTTVWFSLPRN